MSDHPQNPSAGENGSPKRLSEISHLFLSSVRDRQTGGAPRPQRKPPGAPRSDITVDLTPEEFAHVAGEKEPSPPADEPRIAPVTAILGTHLNGRLFDRVKEYASHLCSEVARVGLIEVDAAEFRVMLFERGTGAIAEGAVDAAPIEGFDARRMSEALEELNWDVDRWLLLLPNVRDHDARNLLAQVDHWVLLSTCDHDGVVAGYRTLKGVAELSRPRVSLALLDAHDDAEAAKVARKLASVSQQFLHFPVEIEPPVQRRQNVGEFLVLCCRASREDAAPGQAHGAQWQVVSKFLNRSKPQQPPAVAAAEKLDVPMNDAAAANQPNQSGQSNQPEQPWRQPIGKQLVADVVLNQRSASTATSRAPAAVLLEPAIQSFEIRRDAIPATASSFEMRVEPLGALAATPTVGDDVIDLPQGVSSPAAIIAAMLRRGASDLVDCPVKPPMCPDATVAVSRDRRLVLVAVASQGLRDLRAIGRAYQWLMENRALIAMAIPQFSTDAHQLPRLQLLVDQADTSAEILQPMLQNGNVTVHAYRTLRWAGRVGLLLDAA